MSVHNEVRRKPMTTTPIFTPAHLIARETFANPYPVYRALRDQSPVHYRSLPADGSPGLATPLWSWGLLKYDEVSNALRDHETFSSANPLAGPFGPKLVLIQDDPPRHTRFRRLVNTAFTRKRIEALEPWMTGIANALLDDIGAGETDLVQSYTIPLPVKVIARLLGIPGADYATFKRWSEAFLSTGSGPAARRQTVHAMVEYFGQMAAARRAQGAADLITALVEAEMEGEALQEWEILGFCILVLIAGNETTTNLLGNVFNVVVERPEL